MEEKHSVVNLAEKYKNSAVTYFSKGYGIGQGRAIMPTELSDYYNRIELPFSVPTLGTALATEAVLDQASILNLRQPVRAEKEKLTRGMSERVHLIGEKCES